MGNPSEKPWPMIIGWLQTFLLLAAVAGMFMQVGKQTHQIDLNNEDIRELTKISTDLLKFQVFATAKDQELERRLNEMLDRLNKLETD
tara:strand:- start:2444 stop:2707 length:264 start_codon:yes stop_codon:yes gene_type:complete